MTWFRIEITEKHYDTKPGYGGSGSDGSKSPSRASAAARSPGAGPGQATSVLKDISLELEYGEFVCILGPSGCGKTTLLNLVAGLDKNFEGHISFQQASDRSDPKGGPRIGYVFQNPVLLPWRTVGENLRLVMRPDQIGRGIETELLSEMGLADCQDAYPRDLSLGMSRRVSLARALIIEPDILLMDEPFVSLDESMAAELRHLLMRFWRSRPMTVLLVTHDSREAIQLGQRIIVLAGSPATVRFDEMVMLTNDQRMDPLYIEATRRQILNGTRALP